MTFAACIKRMRTITSAIPRCQRTAVALFEKRDIPDDCA